MIAQNLRDTPKGPREQSILSTRTLDIHNHTDHSATHRHSHTPQDFSRAFIVGISLNVGYVIAEATIGLIAGSLALLADAGHNLSDVLGLALAWGGAYLAKRPPTHRRTYGLRRATILAALLNTVLLILAVGGIAWEAVRRFGETFSIESSTVIWTAAAGVVVNAATTMLFITGRKRDLNIRGAFLHMAADTLVSLGVVVAGIVIGVTGWQTLDPIISLIIVAVIGVGTWGLLRSSVNLALDAVPEGIDPAEVHRFLAGLPGVTGVHDLHIWGMSTSDTALTAHLVKPDPEGDDALLIKIIETLRETFDIDHATIQWERSVALQRSERPDL